MYGEGGSDVSVDNKNILHNADSMPGMPNEIIFKLMFTQNSVNEFWAKISGSR